MEKNKKDWRAIIIYLACFFGIQIIGGFVAGFLGQATDASEEALTKIIVLVTVISYIVTFSIMVAVYFKHLSEECKRLNKNNVIVIIVGTIAILVMNYLITNILVAYNVDMANQDAVTNSMNYYRPLMALSIALFAPVVEEMTFRYSISTLIDNNIAFVIISSMIFAILHGVGIVTFLYALMGAGLAIIYLKTNKNVVASSLVHMLNNLAGLLMMLIMVR